MTSDYLNDSGLETTRLSEWCRRCYRACDVHTPLFSRFRAVHCARGGGGGGGARFGVATFRRGRKAIDRRPSGLVWIERALAAPAGSV